MNRIIILLMIFVELSFSSTFDDMLAEAGGDLFNIENKPSNVILLDYGICEEYTNLEDRNGIKNIGFENGDEKEITNNYSPNWLWKYDTKYASPNKYGGEIIFVSDKTYGNSNYSIKFISNAWDQGLFENPYEACMCYWTNEREKSSSVASMYCNKAEIGSKDHTGELFNEGEENLFSFKFFVESFNSDTYIIMQLHDDLDEYWNDDLKQYIDNSGKIMINPCISPSYSVNLKNNNIFIGLNSKYFETSTNVKGHISSSPCIIEENKWYTIVTYVKWSQNENDGYIRSKISSDGVNFDNFMFGQNDIIYYPTMDNEVERYLKSGLYRTKYVGDPSESQTIYIDDVIGRRITRNLF